MQVTFVVGLPGSGKTHLIQTMVGEKIDDPSIDFPIIDTLGKYQQSDVVIADPNFCDIDLLYRARLVVSKILPNHSLRCIFFDNDPHQCIENVKRRQALGDNRKVFDKIAALSRIYRIPTDVTIPVWRPSA